MTPVANRSTIAANTSRYGKNRLMEIGNVPPICGTPIWRFRRRRTLRRNRRLRWRENFDGGIATGHVQLRNSFDELGNANSDRATGCGFYRSSFHHLLCNPTARAEQGASPGGSEFSDAAMGRSDKGVARKRGVYGAFTSRRALLPRSRRCFETSI